MRQIHLADDKLSVDYTEQTIPITQGDTGEVRFAQSFIAVQGIDVALKIGKQEGSSLIEKLLMPCGLHVCASAEYLKKHGKPEHPSKLEKHNCLIYSQLPNTNNWLFRDGQGKDISIKVNGNLRSGMGSMLMSAAQNGSGIFIEPTL
ncbi:MAG: hypothetical protein KUG80_01355 [Gammaproteobacteria bacterium]|nr:hypothetical protein [Gammaproteobacteria bacterium]